MVGYFVGMSVKLLCVTIKIESYFAKLHDRILRIYLSRIIGKFQRIGCNVLKLAAIVVGDGKLPHRFPPSCAIARDEKTTPKYTS